MKAGVCSREGIVDAEPIVDWRIGELISHLKPVAMEIMCFGGPRSTMRRLRAAPSLGRLAGSARVRLLALRRNFGALTCSGRLKNKQSEAEECVQP